MADEKRTGFFTVGEMFGDYTVEKLLGEGGMGAVYLVRAPGGERYAVKLMSTDMVKKGSDYRKRFAREAEFAMQIRHKNLISVYDVGEDPETGYCYIIMDYVPGGSVADRLEKNGPLPMAEAVSIAAQVALALEVAHRHGVIHRDIKPDNIMFDADGTPKLADLGVAKFTDEAHKTTVTTTGMIIGTPAYMAPEQMMDSHHVDARADIYALGVVLYEMLTGKRPNAESTAVELLAKAIKGEPLPDVRTMRPEVSAAIAHVLSLMCAPKPENRPATALAAAQLLQKAATGRLVLPKKPPRAADAAARKKKRVPWVALAVCAVAGALSMVVVVTRLNRQSQIVSPARVHLNTVTSVVERTVVVTNLVEGNVTATNQEEVMPNAGNCGKVEDYVHDGLLAMWDGIENAGRGRHDPNAKVWKNLAGEPDAVPVDASAAWSENSALFGTSLYYRVDSLFGKPQEVTVEVCHRSVPMEAPDFSALFSSCEFGGIGFQGERGSCWLACVADPSGGYYSELRLPVQDGHAETLAFTVGDVFTVYRDAKVFGTVSGIHGIRYNDEHVFQIGRDPGNHGNIIGEIYSIRLYSRPLAANEIHRNHEVDRVRFGKELFTKDGYQKLKSHVEAPVGSENAKTNQSLDVTQSVFKPIPYVSKSPLHALYRSTDRKHVFVEVCHMNEAVTYVTPRCTVDRLREAIDNKVDILLVSLARSKDGVLFAANDPGDKADLAKVSNGTGRFGEHSADALKKLRVRQAGRLTTKGLATFEELLQIGKGRILFKIDHRMEYATELEELLERLDAWESVIVQVSNGKNLSQKYGVKMLEKMKSGQLIVSCVKGSFPPVRQIIPEATADASYRGRMREQNLKGIPQRIFAAMIFADRTDDEAGWEDALNDGVTILRTGRPRDLVRYLEKTGVIKNRMPEKSIDDDSTQDGDVMQKRSFKDGDGQVPRALKSLVVFPCADTKDMKWKSRAPWRFVTQAPAPSGGKTWMDPGFRDGSWKRTSKTFGIGKDREVIRFAERWRSSSLYLRRHFSWKGGKVKRAEFMLYHACNVKIYLNGTLIISKDDQNDWWEKIEVPVETFAGALQDGDNVLAVEAHAELSARYFDCGLRMETEE